MGKKVYIPQYSGEVAKNFLLEKGYDVISGSGEGFDPEILAECEGIVARAKPFYGEDMLKMSPNLKVIARCGAGVDNVDLEACTKYGVQVTNAPLSNYLSVAEHTFLLILECAKNVKELNHQFVELNNFDSRNTHSGHDVIGQTLGILGMGRIGRKLVVMAQAFDMKVIAYDPFVTQEQAPEGVTMMSRDEVLNQADFVSLHLPSIKETYHFISDNELKLMKKTAYLVNCARGPIVDEKALIKALQEGEIAGAGIDCFEVEPPAADHPFFSMLNVICTPHVAGGTKEANDRMGLHSAQGVHEVLSGEKPTWPVNKL